MLRASWLRTLWARILLVPIVIVIVGAIATTAVLTRLLGAGAEREAHEKATLLAASASATFSSPSRDYAAGQVDLGSSATGHATRRTAEHLKEDGDAAPSRLRIVGMGQSNRANRADTYETRLIAAFEADHTMRRTRDDIASPDGDCAVAAFPIVVSDAACIRCHGSVPPTSRGWKLGQVVGAVVAYVPKAGPRAAAASATRFTLAALSLLGCLAVGLICWNTHRRVTVPAGAMLQTSKAIRRGEWTVRFPLSEDDELLALAVSYQDTTRWLRERVAQEEKLRAMFQQFVPASVAARALGRDASQIIEGGRQTVSVMVINIRNFKLLMEHLPPQNVVTTLNEFFAQVNATIVEHNGLVSKYLGDTVIAFFGMPVQTSTHALDAVRAALAIPRALQNLYVRLDEEHGWQLGVGIGIASGEAIVGHFGSSEHYEYTVMGDVVVEAHALEEVSKGVPEEDTIVVNETAYRSAMSELQVFDLGVRETSGGRNVHAFAVQGLRKEARSVLAA